MAQGKKHKNHTFLATAPNLICVKTLSGGKAWKTRDEQYLLFVTLRPYKIFCENIICFETNQYFQTNLLLNWDNTSVFNSVYWHQCMVNIGAESEVHRWTRFGMKVVALWRKSKNGQLLRQGLGRWGLGRASGRAGTWGRAWGDTFLVTAPLTPPSSTSACVKTL